MKKARTETGYLSHPKVLPAPPHLPPLQTSGTSADPLLHMPPITGPGSAPGTLLWVIPASKVSSCLYAGLPKRSHLVCTARDLKPPLEDLSGSLLPASKVSAPEVEHKAPIPWARHPPFFTPKKQRPAFFHYSGTQFLSLHTTPSAGMLLPHSFTWLLPIAQDLTLSICLLEQLSPTGGREGPKGW